MLRCYHESFMTVIQSWCEFRVTGGFSMGSLTVDFPIRQAEQVGFTQNALLLSKNKDAVLLVHNL